jgi:hypothetical protein
MNVQTRVSKLEEATGINEPCEVCEASSRLSAKITDFNRSIGFKRDKPGPGDLANKVCAWCLRSVATNYAGYSISLRVLFERCEAAFDQGAYCALENETLMEELEAACELQEREWYGTYYESVKALIDEYRAEVEEIFTRTAPRKIYLCRVPACMCDYPKTEKEWQSNVKRRLAA